MNQDYVRILISGNIYEIRLKVLPCFRTKFFQDVFPDLTAILKHLSVTCMIGSQCVCKKFLQSQKFLLQPFFIVISHKKELDLFDPVDGFDPVDPAFRVRR